MRVYIPATLGDLDSCTSGKWEPDMGFAVTERLMEISSFDEDEELAEQARDAAAIESVVEFGSQLRVVIVADYSRGDVSAVPDAHPAAVALTGRVPADAVACAFVDDLAAFEDAKQALAGGPDALERLEDHDLLWYDVTELASIPRP
ncbi:DUF6912 family protein [Demequina oxidasica]|uniref:DUF6912 family protein n=1 Tax=Demequina oxidasica TaxID=676199 RepID=UPI0007860639|nr:hypothetical protein [Demequina oxidasica]